MTTTNGYTIQRLSEDSGEFMNALLSVFGEAFDDADTYGARRPRPEYLRRLLAGDTFIALAAVEGSSLAIAVEARSIPIALPVKSFCRPCGVRVHCGRRLADDARTVSLPVRSNRRLTAATARGRWHRPSMSNRGDDMITYVGLMSFTDKGLQSIKDTTKRAAAAKEAAKKVGVNMRELVWTQGEYDLVSIVEGEDEKAMAAFTLAIAMQGNIRFQTLRAYSSNEMDEILAKLP